MAIIVAKIYTDIIQVDELSRQVAFPHSYVGVLRRKLEQGAYPDPLEVCLDRPLADINGSGDSPNSARTTHEAAPSDTCGPASYLSIIL